MLYLGLLTIAAAIGAQHLHLVHHLFSIVHSSFLRLLGVFSASEETKIAEHRVLEPSDPEPRAAKASPQNVLDGPATDSQACGVCCNLGVLAGPVRSEKVRDEQSFLRGVQDFNESARQGCLWCNAVFDALESLGLDVLSSDKIIVILRKTGACYLWVPSEGATLQFYTPIGSLPAWDGITQGHELSSSADIGETVEFIRSCLDTCDSRHALCKQSTLQMPTRVIDVGLIDDSLARLTDTANMMASPYVALSYCWGKSSHPMTTKSNVQAMTTGIPVAEFPQTIQDAVEVTRRLGLRYLWVDRICIIQDSTRDWEVESAKMASVYHKAYLTIAAGTAACASEGFLHQQHLAAAQRKPFSMKWRMDGEQTSVLAVRVVPAVHTHSISLAGDRQGFLPLNSRGWTLQEELLSRRTITYTQNELWWTCQSQRDCECHAFDEITRDGPRALVSTALMTSPPAAFEHWQAVVSEFCVRQLSYGSDKLPAVSGLASVVREMTGSSYVAGLWREDFLRELNWYSPARTLDKLRDASAKATEAYCAPTFSWASAYGPIGFFKGSFVVSHPSAVTATEWIPRSTLVDATVVVDGCNPLGRVESGYATLRGHLGEASLGAATASVGGLESYALKYNGELVMFYPDMQLEEIQLGEAGPKGTAVVSVHRSPARSRAQTLRSDLPVQMFYLGDWSFPDQNVVQKTYLVLGRSPLDTRKYERLGLAHHETQLGSNMPALGCEELTETITLL